ncbi:MAG: enolase C-terminal domain-like protein [Caldilineaceae bacterium]
MIDAHGPLNETLALHWHGPPNPTTSPGSRNPPPATTGKAWPAGAETTIPIATGENEFTVFDFRDIIAKGAADILQPDLAVVGGFTAARRIGALTHAHNLQCVLMCGDRPSFLWRACTWRRRCPTAQSSSSAKALAATSPISSPKRPPSTRTAVWSSPISRGWGSRSIWTKHSACSRLTKDISEF